MKRKKLEIKREILPEGIKAKIPPAEHSLSMYETQREMNVYPKKRKASRDSNKFKQTSV